ncbi:DEKNAAC103015 [Brettanomyces naardenensis]|uniref:Transcription activator of gluconeogenesis ERT1 n=1 Tax=Brettanomyces naardenensis TaxID=13370 RepID=A0A448YM92_BRENA|nr:DEKNAAC103015 [Brettanomyces naardenensis]
MSNKEVDVEVDSTVQPMDNSELPQSLPSQISSIKKSPDSSPKERVRRRRVPRKKVSRACNHCRKAHITCDESRPCKRCIARHLADSCQDAPRKTKKYLQDETRKANGVSTASSTSSSGIAITNTTSPNNHSFSERGVSNERSSSSGHFLSTAADLEYSVLGRIIDKDVLDVGGANGTISNGNGVSNGNGSAAAATPTAQRFLSPTMSSSSDDLGYLNYQPLMNLQKETPQQSPSQLSNSQTALQPASQSASQSLQPRYNGPQYLYSSTTNAPLFPSSTQNISYSDLHSDGPKCDASTNQYFIGSMASIDGARTYTFPEVVKKISVFRSHHQDEFRRRNKRSAISFSIGVLDEFSTDVFSSSLSRGNSTGVGEYQRTNQYHYTDNDSSTRIEYQEAGKEASKNDIAPAHKTGFNGCGLLYHEPSEIYSAIRAPFPYVRPYHNLNLYLRKRFDKRHLMSMSKSIAEYRPSFIAGMIHLKEDDLIFAEQCFQRTLLEYDNYISISGTPTLVWRRTSQIAYVGDEFCILTGWTKQQLLGRSTFAVEIMDDKSCVEYFRIFSKIAFGDFHGATMTECTLLTPDRESIRTSCIWTMKRDVFGIPMMIIANFLPILT